MKKNIILLITFLLIAVKTYSQIDTSKNANSYYYQAANQYIFEKNIEALRTIEKGLQIYPDNEKLTKLAELILKDAKQQKQSQQKQSQQNKQEEKKDENKKNQEKKNSEAKKDDKQQQQSKEIKISKEDMERLLQAVGNDEKKLQQKLKEENAKSQKVNTEKDW